MNFTRSDIGLVALQLMGILRPMSVLPSVTYVPDLFCYLCARVVPQSHPRLPTRDFLLWSAVLVSR